MRAYEFLLEASGLRNARPGEIYVDDQGTEYKFQSWNWEFPSNAVAFETPEDLEAAILKITKDDTSKISWANQPKGLKSFAFAIFAADDGDEKWVGKFYRGKNANNTIYDEEVKKILGLSAKGTSATIKSEVALQPGNLGLADNRARNIGSIIKSVSTHSQGSMLANALKQASNKQSIVFTGGATYSKALQDDFGEIVSPISIMTENPFVTGQYKQAISDVFKGSDISDASISFPVEQNNPLIDSYIIKDGITLGVSSKGKQGANATITNIWKAKEEAAQNSTGKAYIKKFPEAVTILDICKDASGLEQPIILAERYKIINSKEANTLRQMIQNPRDPMYKLIGNPKNPNAVIKDHLPKDLAKVPPSMMRIFKMGGYKSGSYVSFLCLARVAHLVRDYINSNAKIDFGEAVRSFLNSSAMVQAKTVVGPKGQDAILKNINVVYPPNFQEKATIQSNGYSGTQAKGKFSFKLPST